MGMSMHVRAMTTSDSPEFQKHAAVLRACVDAGVKLLPQETAEFFGSKYPEPYLLEEALVREVPLTEWRGDAAEGFELKVKDIPPEIDTIRFYASW